MVNSVIPESLWDPRGLAGENIFMRTSVLDSPDDERVADEIGSARVILYDSITFPERLLARLPALEILIRTGDGHDAIDMEAATRLGIVCINQPGIWSRDVAHFAYTAGLLLVRRVPVLGRYSAESTDAHIDYPKLLGQLGEVPRVEELAVGIVGFGYIGQWACRYYAACVKTIYVTDSHTTQESLDEFAREHGISCKLVAAPLGELCGNSDIITLHIPGRAGNAALFDEKLLGECKTGAVLINCARGSVVDTDALTAALTSGKLGGALLDTTAPEPLPPDHPLLRSIPNVVVTPHIAWYTHDAQVEMRNASVETLRCIRDGKRPSNIINTELLGRRADMRAAMP